MKISKDLAISDSGFVFNPATGESFRVNEVGLFIISLIKADTSEAEIIQRITEKYEVSELEVKKDFLDFKNMMKIYNLIK